MKLIAKLEFDNLICSPNIGSCFIYNNMFDCLDHLNEFGEVEIIKELSYHNKDEFGRICLKKFPIGCNGKTINLYFTTFYGKEK